MTSALPRSQNHNVLRVSCDISHRESFIQPVPHIHVRVTLVIRWLFASRFVDVLGFGNFQVQCWNTEVAFPATSASVMPWRSEPIQRCHDFNTAHVELAAFLHYSACEHPTSGKRPSVRRSLPAPVHNDGFSWQADHVPWYGSSGRSDSPFANGQYPWDLDVA